MPRCNGTRAWVRKGYPLRPALYLELSAEVPVPGVPSPVEVLVGFQYSPGSPHVYTLSNGDPGYPGDPPEVELLSVTGPDGEALLGVLDRATLDALTDRACSAAEDAQADGDDDNEPDPDRDWDSRADRR